MDNEQQSSAARLQTFRSVWPWLLLAAWLTASAAQIWGLEVESVLRGDACTATPAGLWTGAAP